MPTDARNGAIQRVKRGLSPLMDALYPPHCVGCQRTGAIICADCLAQMAPLALPVCPCCGIPVPQAALCQSCQRDPPRITALRSASKYQEPLRGCIRALKYEGNTRLAEPLGLVLAQAFRRYGLSADALLPVPLHPERHAKRGYNHATLLAQVCARHLALPCYEQMLLRHRDTLSQVGLTPRERQQNVQGAFVCSPAFTRGALTGRTLLLIDDVCTSGATLEACAAPLFAAGAAAVIGLALARPV
ncbi:MAG TPA: ComF family protein [Ktedonobacteraceae bacterium]|nr:ComF family protein [Ktedonobacteraceae bacterium]